MPFAFFKVCATNFGDICHAVGQEATEKFLVCEVLPLVIADALVGALLKAVVKFCVHKSVALEWQLNFAFITFKFLGF